MAENLFVRYKVRCEVREKLVANFPENVEALKWIVKREQKQEKLTDSEAKALQAEMEANLNEAQQYVNGEEELVTGRNIFLRDEKGIYITPRNVKGWLKEALKTLGVRGYREAVNHGVFVTPRRIYIMRNGEAIKQPDGEETKPIQVIGMRGPRSSIKVSEVIRAPAWFEFEVAVVERLDRGVLTKSVMEKAFRLGGEIGFLGDRSLQEGQVEVTFRRL